MQRMFRFFLLFIALLPTASFSDTVESNVGADKNMSIIEEKILNNELKFKDITTEVQKRYPDSDWSGFEELDSGSKRIIIKNILAQEAFSEIRDNFKKDIYSRTKDAISQDDYGDEIHYYNSSDKLYRTDYVYDDIMTEAEKQGLLYETQGANWKHFKQKDMPALDKIIAKYVSKAPADMHCEKNCIKPRSHVDQDWAQKYLADFKKHIDEYEKSMRDIFKESNDWTTQKKEEYKEDPELLKMFEASEQKHRIEEQEFENEILEMRKEYDNLLTKSQEINIWEHNPYNKNCDMISIGCWNVEHIPSQYERLQLQMSKEDKNLQNIIYSYDDLKNNEHVEQLALKECKCKNTQNNDYKSVNCSCDISFLGIISDFDKYRNYENQDRIDIKNGKLQDVTDKGKYKHNWEGNKFPVGRVFNTSLKLFGEHNETKM